MTKREIHGDRQNRGKLVVETEREREIEKNAGEKGRFEIRKPPKKSGKKEGGKGLKETVSAGESYRRRSPRNWVEIE